ncbi:hypothetical protein [Terriglobus tenax]|uniref:hypothetical protein n=1 Tax=Terriglobus tenax TaxID=1111115 RepID=UPI0021E0CB61|nr:hypothetical protein [Terriglobus tenax]
MYLVGCYVAYLLLSLVTVVWVAQTLHKNGRPFLLDAFHGNTSLADSVNHLLVVGFYLINIGYVTLALRENSGVGSLQNAIEVVSTKIGTVLLLLGLMHFFNIYLFNRARKAARHPRTATEQAYYAQRTTPEPQAE